MWKRDLYLVYRFNSNCCCPELPPTRSQGVWADRDSVQLLFRDDPKRMQRFLRLLDSGYLGHFFHIDGQWTSYTWMSRPHSNGPLHMPRGIRMLRVNWITFCQTRTRFQGRGLYKAGLCKLVQRVREDEPTEEIYIDTSPDNFASRRAIVKVGFCPHGLIRRKRIRVPKVKSWFWGDWNEGLVHPPLKLGDGSFIKS
jgi:hypothetical protein